MPRLPQITSSEGLSEEQRAVYESIATGARGGVRGPHTILLHNPELASRVEKLGKYLRYDCNVPQRLRELAILVIAVRWNAEYEWYAHAPIALGQGVPQNVLDAIKAGAVPDFDHASDRAVYEFVKELVAHGTASESVFQSAESVLSTQGVLDLTALVGYYTFLAFVLNAFDVQPPR